MRPLELTLTGFRGIQAGMQLETFHIDMRTFGDARLVAIVAPNGRGKTTVLDNLQPYRLMPSKIANGNYSPDAFSFFDHLVRPGDACKDLIWEHDGVVYRSLLEWKLREKSQTQSAYLQQRDGDGWKPVTLPDGTSSDGKAGTYDRCVEGILGSPRLYFTAAFSAQGRSQLSSYKQGDIKGLMSEVLGLHRIQELGEKAADVSKGLRARLTDRRDQLAKLDGIRQQANELRTAITEHTLRLNGVHLPSIELARHTIANEQMAVTEMQRSQQDAEELRVRRQAVLDRIAVAGGEYGRALALIQQDIKTEEERHEETLQRIRAEIERITGGITRAEQRRNAATLLLAERDKINDAIARLPTLRDDLSRADHAVTAAQNNYNAANQAKATLQQLNQHINTLVDAGKRARATEQDLTTRCALTKEVPCQGTDLQGRCRLLTDALTAEGQLPAARADIEAKTAEYQSAAERKANLTKEAEKAPALLVELQKAQAARKDAAELVTNAEKLAAKSDGLVAAEESLADAEDSLRAGGEQLQEANDQQKAAEQQHEERRAALQARIDTLATANQATMQQLQTELDRIPVPDDDSQLQAAQQRLAEAQKAEQDARDAAERTRGAIANAEGRLSTLEDSLAAGDALSSEVGHLENELAHWNSLQKALGRDGILALSIDDAGPTLAGLTNDLLLSCYGPRFSVRIDTQETVKTTGVQKETFDVIVFDSESDTSKSVSEMSGGERIWINEALTRAIALYQAQQSGRTFHTLFSDESDGALDPEKKGQFVQMKRRVLELGGYDNEYFISHSPDVWPLADAVLDLGAVIEAH